VAVGTLQAGWDPVHRPAGAGMWLGRSGLERDGAPHVQISFQDGCAGCHLPAPGTANRSGIFEEGIFIGINADGGLRKMLASYYKRIISY